MRDRRFVAVHRGGPLDLDSHRILARWGADCAKRVLPFYERESKDQRPRLAIEAVRAWARGKTKPGVAMKAALAAHAAAREAQNASSIAAARAAGQAAGAAHCADHCMGALLYALEARAADGRSVKAELRRQLGKLPGHLRDQVRSGVMVRLGHFKFGKSLA
ncbi:MAG: putative immunity protein [Chthoniobacterales bacterium]|jgi:Xaa-Pro aminopeptidase